MPEPTTYPMTRNVAQGLIRYGDVAPRSHLDAGIVAIWPAPWKALAETCDESVVIGAKRNG